MQILDDLKHRLAFDRKNLGNEAIVVGYFGTVEIEGSWPQPTLPKRREGNERDCRDTRGDAGDLLPS